MDAIADVLTPFVDNSVASSQQVATAEWRWVMSPLFASVDSVPATPSLVNASQGLPISLAQFVDDLLLPEAGTAPARLLVLMENQLSQRQLAQLPLLSRSLHEGGSSAPMSRSASSEKLTVPAAELAEQASVSKEDQVALTKIDYVGRAFMALLIKHFGDPHSVHEWFDQLRPELGDPAAYGHALPPLYVTRQNKWRMITCSLFFKGCRSLCWANLLWVSKRLLQLLWQKQRWTHRPLPRRPPPHLTTTELAAS